MSLGAVALSSGFYLAVNLVTLCHYLVFPAAIGAITLKTQTDLYGSVMAVDDVQLSYHPCHVGG